MEDSVKKETKKSASPNFFEGVKMEFKKISWPDRKTTFKQSVAVVIISVVVGAVIAILDFGAKNGVNFLTNLGVK
ncbi:MAG: preprotein translocase subunit SecE [Lachnospiraceae bacterium]|nr:preprotein translocase subunit SecE [Lachnospiraceae bacterium]